MLCRTWQDNVSKEGKGRFKDKDTRCKGKEALNIESTVGDKNDCVGMGIFQNAIKVKGKDAIKIKGKVDSKGNGEIKGKVRGKSKMGESENKT